MVIRKLFIVKHTGIKPLLRGKKPPPKCNALVSLLILALSMLGNVNEIDVLCVLTFEHSSVVSEVYYHTSVSV